MRKEKEDDDRGQEERSWKSRECHGHRSSVTPFQGARSVGFYAGIPSLSSSSCSILSREVEIGRKHTSYKRSYAATPLVAFPFNYGTPVTHKRFMLHICHQTVLKTSYLPLFSSYAPKFVHRISCIDLSLSISTSLILFLIFLLMHEISFPAIKERYYQQLRQNLGKVFTKAT